MNIAMLDILRCPYCGGHLELVSSLYHRSISDQIHDGILGCQCCIFPVVDGIPVLHLQAATVIAREHVEAGRPQQALRTLVGLNTEEEAERFEAFARSETSTYRDMVEALGPSLEGSYFLYRFSDPTFIVADAVVRAVVRGVLGSQRRAVDVCGGSGHLTRALLELSTPPPVLADLSFPKIWLARRFTAPGCEPVCCDGNAPLPFARGSFGYAMCSDALHYVWTKRQLIGELTRLVDGAEAGTVVINHAHNQLAWSPSHGQPLSPAGYRALFETIEPRIYSEARLLAEVVSGGPLDLAQMDAPTALDVDPALTIVASRDQGVYARHRLESSTAPGEYRVNPLYQVERDADLLRLRLQFPGAAYEDEYGACREYLPEEATIDRLALAALQTDADPGPLAALIRSRVIVRLPHRYY